MGNESSTAETTTPASPTPPEAKTDGAGFTEIFLGLFSKIGDGLEWLWSKMGKLFSWIGEFFAGDAKASTPAAGANPPAASNPPVATPQQPTISQDVGDKARDAVTPALAESQQASVPAAPPQPAGPAAALTR